MTRKKAEGMNRNKIIILICIFILLSGCQVRNNKDSDIVFNPTESAYGESVGEPGSDKQQNDGTTDGQKNGGKPDEAQPVYPTQEEREIRIALIDTGITKTAVNSEHVLSGWNYCTNSDVTEDTIGHGTSLAGLILGSEKAGLPGGAPDAFVIPLVYQVSDADGHIEKAKPEELAQIIVDAVDQYDCDIISISAGVKTDYEEMREAVKYAAGKGVLVISCAGNEGNGDIYYPGGYEEVLCVGSANQELNGRADFSQANDTVDVLAPGEKIRVVTMKGNVMEVSGTSYSAAYITAAVAKLWQKHPADCAEWILEYLMQDAVAVGDAVIYP